ncbi:MAG: hypothetical protein JNJ57_18280, partial [Saprospiraceae bacterium]|nr:hypothetical protein [Saprospiraceae bacterium]
GFNAFAQPKLSNVLPLDAYYLTIDGRGAVLKTTIDSLIALHNSSLINDTTRVAIVFQLGEYRCVRCVEFLLDNLSRDYFYGDNYSDDDIDRKEAAFAALKIIARDPDKGWYLFPHLLYSLKQERRERPLYYLRLSRLLSLTSSRTTVKSIIDREFVRDAGKERMPFSRSIYVDNLNLILKKFEED